jgi:hypothetical protein
MSVSTGSVIPVFRRHVTILKTRNLRTEKKLHNFEWGCITAVTMNNAIFWVVTPYSSERIRRFGWIYSLQLHGRKAIQTWNQHKQSGKLNAFLYRILALLTFRRWRWKRNFLRTFRFFQNYMALQPRDLFSSNRIIILFWSCPPFSSSHGPQPTQRISIKFGVGLILKNVWLILFRFISAQNTCKVYSTVMLI